MVLKDSQSTLILFLGDLVSLSGSLWLTLVIRHGRIPSSEVWLRHLTPFLIIFILWLIVFFIYDLYNLRLMIFRTVLGPRLVQAQLINTAAAVGFFYFIPYFSITPKLILFIFLVVSFGALFLWRYIWGRFWLRGRTEDIIFACQGPEAEKMARVLSQQVNYQVTVCEPEALPEETDSLVVVDFGRARSGDLYSKFLRGVNFVSASSLYEKLFGRVPLSLISERWFLENISSQPKPVYDLLKRLVDMTMSFLFGLLSLLLYPLIIFAIWCEDGRPFFFTQPRVGYRGRSFKLLKFRTMRDDEVTRVGRFLRRSRLDELPQLWNVFKGDLSLVGPRPERPDYASKYREMIAHYDIRHLIAPGLSGWAQIYHENHPHFSLAAEFTEEKLSYDLYYLKHRGLWLDLKIILKTLNTFLSRQGR